MTTENTRRAEEQERLPAKKQYETPVLETYGEIGDIMAGGSGRQADGGPGSMTKSA